MKFLLLLHDDAEAVGRLSAEQRRAIVDAHVAFSSMLRERGALVLGEALHDPAHARAIRFPADGAPVVTDGPFVEAKEAVGGFYVIDCRDSAEAQELALRVPRSPGLVAELIPIVDV